MESSSFYRIVRSSKPTIKKVARRVAIALVLALPASAMAERAVVERTKPVYPEIARRLKVTGTVLLDAVVSPDGTVKSVNLVMGNSALAEAAKEAILKWKYAPADTQTTEQVEIVFHDPK